MPHRVQRLTVACGLLAAGLARTQDLAPSPDDRPELLFVRVIDSDTRLPIAGATVRVGDTWTADDVPRTDALGELVLTTGPRSEPVRAFAQASGYLVMDRLGGYHVDPWDDAVIIALEPARRLEFVILAGEGEYVRDQRDVRLQALSPLHHEVRDLPMRASVVDGRLVLPAVGPVFGPALAHLVDGRMLWLQEPFDRCGELTTRPVFPRTLRVRVIDEDERPVGRATVRLHDLAGNPRSPNGRTDESGEVTFEDLYPTVLYAGVTFRPDTQPACLLRASKRIDLGDGGRLCIVTLTTNSSTHPPSGGPPKRTPMPSARYLERGEDRCELWLDPDASCPGRVLTTAFILYESLHRPDIPSIAALFRSQGERRNAWTPEPDAYRVTYHALGYAPTIVENVRITKGVVNLGRIELHRGITLSVCFEMPPGCFPPADRLVARPLHALLPAWSVPCVDVRDHTRLTGLGPGPHRMSIESDPLGATERAPVVFELTNAPYQRVRYDWTDDP